VRQYLEDACRVFNLNIFKVELYEQGIIVDGDKGGRQATMGKADTDQIDGQDIKEDFDRPSEIIYFTNRFELGKESVYPKLLKAAPLLSTVSESEFEAYKSGHVPQSGTERKKMHSSILKDFGLKDSSVLGYNLLVEIKGTDFQGRPLAVETKHDSIETVAAYLKLINIPCIFDLGTRTPNHKHGTLAMNLMDDSTFTKVIKPDFLDRERAFKPKKIAQVKEAVQACHVNIDVSEVVITVLGYVVGHESTSLSQPFNRVLIDDSARKILNEMNEGPEQNETVIDGFEVPLWIDGKFMVKKVRRLVINQLMKNSQQQATIPIQTFLPF